MLLTQLRRAVVLAVIAFVFVFVYALVGTGLSQLLFKDQASGSITANGSTMIGQSWSGTKWFHGRPDSDDPLSAKARDETVGRAKHAAVNSNVFAKQQHIALKGREPKSLGQMRQGGTLLRHRSGRWRGGGLRAGVAQHPLQPVQLAMQRRLVAVQPIRAAHNVTCGPAGRCAPSTSTCTP